MITAVIALGKQFPICSVFEPLLYPDDPKQIRKKLCSKIVLPRNLFDIGQKYQILYVLAKKKRKKKRVMKWRR